MRALANSLRWTLAALAVLLFSFSASAQISRTGSVSATATSGTFSATATGDLKIVWAYRSGSTTAPSLPAGWTTISTVATATGGTTGVYRIGCNKSSSSGDTGTGTWTNATAIAGVSYAGTAVGTTANCNTTGIGNTSNTSAKTSTTASYNTITVANTNNGNSWVAGFLGGSAGSTCSPASGMPSVSATGDVRVSDTNGKVTSWSTATCTVSSETWMSFVAEILSVTTTEVETETLTTTPSLIAPAQHVEVLTESLVSSSSSDNFNRANGGLGANWTSLTVGVAAPQILSNMAAPAAVGGSFSLAYYSAVSFPNDQYAEAKIGVATTSVIGSVQGPCVRMTETASTFSAYCGVIDGPLTAAFFEIIITTSSGLNYLSIVPAPTVSVGDVLRLIVEGSNLTLERNGVVVTTAVDGTLLGPLTSGAPGLLVSNSTSVSDSELDDWAAGSGHLIDICFVCKNAQNIQEGNVTVDSLSAVHGLFGNLTVTLTESDSVTQTDFHFRTITDTVTESDSSATVRAMHSAMTETLTESDSIGIVHNTTKAGNLFETLTTTPAIAEAASIHEAVSETLTTSLSVLAQKQSNFSVPLTENLVIVIDTLISAGNHAAIIETLTESDSCTASRCNPRSMTEGYVTTDSVSIIKSQVSLSETLSPSQSVATTRSLHVGMTENLTESDTIIGVKTIHAIAITETLTESDASTPSAGRQAPLTESHTISDVVAEVKTAHPVTLTETLTLTEHISLVQCIQFPSEFLTGTDSIAVEVVHNAQASMTDTLATITDVASARANHLVLITETLTTTALIAAPAQHPRSLTENLTTTATTSLQSAHVTGMSDSVAVSDSIAASKTNQQLSGSLVDTTPVITDTLSAISAHFANTFDFLTESDSVRGGVNKVLVETLTLSDVIRWQTGKGATENLTTVATVRAIAAHTVVMIENLSSGVTLTVTVTKTAQQFGNAVEFLTPSDVIQISAGRSTQLLESLFLFDALTVSRPSQLFANPVEFLIISDVVAGTNPLTLRKRFIVVDTP